MQRPSRDVVHAALAVRDDAVEGHLCDRLCAACALGDDAEVQTLIQDGADIRYQDEDTGDSPLMLAAAAGHLSIVQVLLQHGAPWNAQNKRDESAGDCAIRAEQISVADYILEWACVAEELLSSHERARVLAEENDTYLSDLVRYDDEGGKLLDAKGDAVMMAWEKPLMLAHANLICQGGGDILNVGFGLGLVDEAIQSYKPASHTIIEAHPDVYRRMVEQGWRERPGVRILFGKWEDVAAQLGQYDGIFFDTYAEHYEHMRAFHALLPNILKAAGIYSFFNGLAPRCSFFHTVYCRIVERHLDELGLATQFMELPVPVEASDWDGHWRGVRGRYWFRREYQLPIVYWQNDGTGDTGDDVGGQTIAAR